MECKWVRAKLAGPALPAKFKRSSLWEGPILDQHAISSHLSHQPPLYVLIQFLLHELVQLVLILLHKIKSTRTDVVDSSNESL